ncbi:hypothetical protein Tco_1291485 [Tanacetum coccineum]
MDDKKPVVQKQRRLNPNMQEVVKKEIMKLLDIGIINPIINSPWVSPIYCVPNKGGITVVTNENDELVPTRTVTGSRVCIDYRKLNEATAKDHFPLRIAKVQKMAADHLSRIENEEISDDSEVDDNFPRETLMEINTRDEPWTPERLGKDRLLSDGTQRLRKDSLSAKSQKATSDVFKSKTSSRKSKIT